MSEYLNYDTEAAWLAAIAKRGLNKRRITLSERGRPRIGNHFIGQTGYAAIMVSAAGTTEITLKAWCPQHVVALSPGSGSGTYTHTVVLPLTQTDLNGGSTLAALAGDTITVRLLFPASANPTIEIRNASAAGTLLLSVAGTGTAFAQTVQAVWSGAGWELHNNGSAPASSGAASVSDASVYWVNAVAGGSDSTGNGSPSAPYATAQKAYDVARVASATAPIAIRAVGSVGGITGAVLKLTLIGVGSEKTIFGDIAGTTGYVRGNGAQMVTVGNITIQAAHGAVGADGVSPVGGGYVTGGGAGGAGSSADASAVMDLTATDILLAAGTGGDGGVGGSAEPGSNTGGADGGSGGTAGTGALLTVSRCNYSAAVSRSGNGGTGGVCGLDSGGSPSGNQGAGTNGGGSNAILLVDCEESGPHDAPAAAGGNGASPGPLGVVRAKFSTVPGVALTATDVNYASCFVAGVFTTA